MIKDLLTHFTTIGTPFAPTATGDNVAPFTYDTSPLGLPTGSGGGGTVGYNAGASANAGRDLGIGGEMWWNVLVTTAVAQTSGGLTFALVTDSTATITTVNTLLASPNLTAATLVVQYAFKAQLPASLVYKQYLGFNVNIVTNVLTAGAFESELVINIQQADLYLSGFAIS